MSLKEQYEFLVFLLVAILILELVARRLGLPPAASFIAGGMALAFVPGVPVIEIDPDLVMVVFLPPLLMSSAYFTIWRDFKDQWRGIFSLAFGAVIFTTMSVGWVVHLVLPELPLPVAFALGAVVSPPDAVAASAVLSKLNLPSRLVALLEGESLVNDATGLVLFAIAVTAALTGEFSVYQATGSFIWLTAAGTSVGLGTGWLGIQAIKRLPEPELVVTATLLLSTTSYVAGEAVGGSGVLSTVATGLVIGWNHHEAVPAATRVGAQSFWKALVFIMESLLFILIGLSLRGLVARLSSVTDPVYLGVVPVSAVVATVVIARFVWISGCAGAMKVRQASGYASRNDMSPGSLVVIAWSGMRGVVTLTAALSFPAELPGRDLVLVASFAVIVVTVLLQGSTLAPLARALGVAAPEEAAKFMESKVAVRRHLSAIRGETAATGKSAGVQQQSTADIEEDSEFEADRIEAAVQRVRAARAELLRIYRKGDVHENVMRDIEHELDLEEMGAQLRKHGVAPDGRAAREKS
ncbi:CPA1 family monovalent cation:H+ antiporter [Rhizobium leguminosarum]|uniref:CPA1 family monovalent cation:H+ antiporter n=1 Tax=Rhizobium leguminosarum TaxID=384 RepID=A0AAE2MLE4_RHILE|nr:MULTISPECIES: sodium:proton antiporter [Rhizobium]MBB4291426.1 CPA1 family monovalent cation:H+ antiporter [Rhizobium leguminosarum]MBB4296122.1 CPA1 family monovalent cation:H+ antiporter [Rhizobium leguminosarum]MBB4308619.1 CPA1 family monovalent cation:H+ antiporter [Rhizobium leguminosarum]MBB4416454.1 CPA1 family monovalent cation:H+ antiporter [Rhizobium leguminosarum]MBB4430579.1 CPA1 family monovalent cation:H+ antiporter [Rhizobium esperanzae]